MSISGKITLNAGARRKEIDGELDLESFTEIWEIRTPECSSFVIKRLFMSSSILDPYRQLFLVNITMKKINKYVLLLKSPRAGMNNETKIPDILGL